MKPLEEDLAEYLLSLQRGPWSKQYNRECLNLWRGLYGETIADRVASLVKKKWKG